MSDDHVDDEDDDEDHVEKGLLTLLWFVMQVIALPEKRFSTARGELIKNK